MKREGREVSRVLLLHSFAEAQVLEATLSAREIPALVRAFNDPAFGSFWRREGSWGELLAYPEDGDEIRRIYEQLNSEREES